MQPADSSPQRSPRRTPWQVIHALSVGTSHLSSGLACQDAADWRLLPSGLLAIALADGAGSAPESETGANLAVNEALMTLENAAANETPDDPNAWGLAVQEAFQAARLALEAEAQIAGLPVQAFATTLICLVAAGDGLVLGQIGDGVLVARTPAGDLHTLTQPQRGQYANETLFLTMPDALEQAYFQIIELELAGLAVMSDGLSRLALQLPSYSPHAPFFIPLWAFTAQAQSGQLANQELAAFLASERVCARTDDDKSLVIAVRTDFQIDDSLPPDEQDPRLEA
jgi:hypothetical protein